MARPAVGSVASPRHEARYQLLSQGHVARPSDRRGYAAPGSARRRVGGLGRSSASARTRADRNADRAGRVGTAPAARASGATGAHRLVPTPRPSRSPRRVTSTGASGAWDPTRAARTCAGGLPHAIKHLGEKPVDEISAGDIDDMVDAMLRERDAITEAAAQGAALVEDYRRRAHRARPSASASRAVEQLDQQGRPRPYARSSRTRCATASSTATSLTIRTRLVREDGPRRSFLEPFQVAALLDAGAALEQAHRGLTWEDVHAIRASSDSNVALARRYHVSDGARSPRSAGARYGSTRRNATATTSRGPSCSRRWHSSGCGSASCARWTARTSTSPADASTSRACARTATASWCACRASRPRRPSASSRCCRPLRPAHRPQGRVRLRRLTTRCSPPATAGATAVDNVRRTIVDARVRACQRAARGPRAARDRALHAAHAAAHVRLDPRPSSTCRHGGRCTCSATPIRPSRCASTSRSSTWGRAASRPSKKLIGCTLDEAFALLSGRGVLATNWQPADKSASQPGDVERAGRRGNARSCRTFFEAAEGTRTLDLLHGKQTL